VNNDAYLPLVTLSEQALQAAQSGLLIAASDRLRRECRYAYDYQQMRSGRTAWPAPSISGFEALQRHAYEQATRTDPECEALLTAVEQHELFRRCAPQGLVHLTPLFEDAWQQLHNWQLDSAHAAFAESENTRVFATWARNVEGELARKNALTSVHLASRGYPEDVRSGPIHLLGFDVLNPAQQQWVGAAKANGSELTVDDGARQGLTSPPPGDERTGLAARFLSPIAELTAAICWARATLEAAPTAEPLPRIAIVVPDLLQQHATVNRLLHAHLEGSEHRQAVLYNLGGGLPLTQQPLVASALRFLSSIHNQLHYTELEQILVDPALPAINTTKHLPANCTEFVALQDVPADICSEPLRVILRSIQGWPNTTSLGTNGGSLRRTVREWWQAAASVLRTARWHTARNDSEGYQATNALLDVLISQAPDRDNLLSWADAFALLSSVAAQTLFAPAGQPAPLQVLGYLEAQELEFDHLWITGMSETAWPTPVATNPLLPVSVLTQAGVPRTTYASELRFAQHWLQRITRSPLEQRASFADDALAPETELTEPGNNAPLGISALLAHWQPAPTTDSQWHPTVGHWQDQTGANAPELMPTETAPEQLIGPAPQPPNLRRATRRLQDQAACPMRGWATHQLNLDDRIKPHTLPNPLERGNVLHEALDRLYKEVTSSASLQKLSDSEEKLLCMKIARLCVDKQMTRYTKPVRTLETERLVSQLRHFLTIERRRGEFQVHALEENSNASIGPYEIALRPDRIDDTPGGQLVVDYKSSAPTRSSVLDERLSAPQIPLYILLQLANGKAIDEISLNDPIVIAGAFAELKPEGAKYVGLRNENTDLGAKSIEGYHDWSGLLRRWRNQLTLLAEEVATGVADAKPTTSACSNCNLQPFCRYHLRND